MSGIIDIVGSKSGIVGSDVYPTGHVIQVVHLNKTATATVSVAAGAEGTVPSYELNITPKFASSKILISWSIHAVGAGPNPCMATLSRTGYGSINYGDAAGSRKRVGTDNSNDTTYTTHGIYHTEIDSPNTTSSITYTVGVRHHSSITRVININFTLDDVNDHSTPRTTSSMTAMEIAQ
jgi:hypothetical protein